MALSGGNNRATALLLNASPYRAIVHPYRPQVQDHIEATTILTRGEARHARARALVEAPGRYTISEQVIAEVSKNLLQKVQLPEGRLIEIVESFYTRCHVVVPDIATHRAASRLRHAYQLSYWDSLIVAAALGAGCAILYSEDMQHNQVIEGRLTVIDPLRG